MVDIVDIVDIVDTVNTVKAIWNNARLCNNQSKKQSMFVCHLKRKRSKACGIKNMIVCLFV